MTQLTVQNQFMNVIERVATDPAADMGKLEKMLDMQERVIERESQQAFAADMSAMQSEMPRVFKMAQGHNITYARLEDINDSIRPVLQKYGFCVTFKTEQTDLKSVSITAICSHKLGSKQDTTLILPLDTSGSKNAVQAVGSTVSYGKRYAMCALLNISTGDDTNGFNLGKSAEEVSGKSPVSQDDIKRLFEYLSSDKTPLEFQGWVNSLDEDKYNELFNSGEKGKKMELKNKWREKELNGSKVLNDIRSALQSDDDETREDAEAELATLTELEQKIINKSL
tara:strand:+ start:376 stop:1221 length:846 start_codon:yes stop_codon:yes gene_type:complete